MPAIGWSMTVGDAAGSGVQTNATLQADAAVNAVAEIEAGASRALELQIDDVSLVRVRVVTCSRYDGSVSRTGGAAGDPTLALTGPIFAFGSAAARLAGVLGTVTVAAAAAPATSATVTFFVATALS